MVFLSATIPARLVDLINTCFHTSCHLILAQSTVRPEIKLRKVMVSEKNLVATAGSIIQKWKLENSVGLVIVRKKEYGNDLSLLLGEMAKVVWTSKFSTYH
jgi:hypothetical protein